MTQIKIQGWRGGHSYSDALILGRERPVVIQPITVEKPQPWKPVVRVSEVVVKRRRER